jgi:outer membrane protein assembly factor BamB
MTGALSRISSLGTGRYGASGGITYGDGLLYAITADGIDSIDPMTGASNRISNLGTGALGFSGDITYGDSLLYAINGGGTYSIDPMTGAVSTISSLGTGSLKNSGGIVFAAVPIAPAAWLFGSALGVMGVLRRKATA